MEPQTFAIASTAFDLTLLPVGARTLGTPAFQEAVNAFLQHAFQGFGGRVTIFVDDMQIAVTWNPPDPLDVIMAKMKEGQHAESIQMLEFLLSREPDNVTMLSRMGMELSGAGELDKADTYLRRVVAIQPEFTNFLVAMGLQIYHQRMHDEAIRFLQSAVRLEPENPWACRHLAMTLLKLSRFDEAADHLHRAVVLKPDDQCSWATLGDALRLAGQPKDAEEAYCRAIALCPYGEWAEAARRGSNQLPPTFQDRAAGAPRQDAVDCCVAAIKTLSMIPKDEVKKIAFEISMAGGNGFDVNKPKKKYRLKSMPGKFTGLQLVCYMQACSQIIEPGRDIGWELWREYQMAKTMAQAD